MSYAQCEDDPGALECRPSVFSSRVIRFCPGVSKPPSSPPSLLPVSSGEPTPSTVLQIKPISRPVPVSVSSLVGTGRSLVSSWYRLRGSEVGRQGRSTLEWSLVRGKDCRKITKFGSLDRTSTQDKSFSSRVDP